MSDQAGEKKERKRKAVAPTEQTLRLRAIRRIENALAALDDEGMIAVLAYINASAPVKPQSLRAV